jgi:hypothetical protein
MHPDNPRPLRASLYEKDTAESVLRCCLGQKEAVILNPSPDESL